MVVMTIELKNLASALIIMGALVSCGEDVSDISYSSEDKGIALPAPALSHREKCYGIALAQYNDCANLSGQNCAGTSQFDYQSDAWKYTKQGTCEEKGGSLESKPDARLGVRT